MVFFIKNPSLDTAQLELPFLKTEDKLERDVIAYFCKKMDIPGRSPLDTEIEFARSLLDSHKLKDIQFIINFAIEQAKSTNFQMQTLNAIKQYLYEAEVKLDRIKKKQEAEKTERELKRQREIEIIQEEAEDKKLDQIFNRLSREEQDQIEEQAKQNIINAHPGKSSGSLKYSLSEFSIKIEVWKILKTRFKDQ